MAKRKDNTLLIGLVAGGAALAVFLSVACGVGLYLMGGKGSGWTGQGGGVPTRGQFQAKVMGQDQNGVIAAVGKPARTRDDHWVYHDATRDPITGKIDGVVLVYFRDGRVVSVSY